MINSTRLSVAFAAGRFFSSASQAVVIETVLVGNAGNAADTQIMSDGTIGYGTVAYEYRIGKYEVTNAQYAEFLNTVDPAGANALRLYINQMSTSQYGGINFDAAASNGSKYFLKPGFANLPVVWVSFYDTLRFTNWLHNGQGNGDTENGAYTLNGMMDNINDEPRGASITRNPGAKWFLPSEDEWYKAAYHSNDGITGNYWDFPTGSDSPPTASAPPGGVAAANYRDAVGAATAVGAYSQSPSPYGTFDQAGNVYEWNEGLIIQRGTFRDHYFRGLRGSSWFGGGTDTTQFLAASHRPAVGCDGVSNPTCSSRGWGFRVASVTSVVPEPSTSLLILSGVAVALLTLRRVRGVVDLEANSNGVLSKCY